jgi:hypothetical protein
MGQIEFPILQSFSEKCLAATTTAEITSAFDAILKPHGILQWYVGNLGFVNESRGFGFDEIPAGWRKRYVEAEHARFDPVFQHAVNQGRPRGPHALIAERLVSAPFRPRRVGRI